MDAVLAEGEERALTPCQMALCPLPGKGEDTRVRSACAFFLDPLSLSLSFAHRFAGGRGLAGGQIFKRGAQQRGERVLLIR